MEPDEVIVGIETDRGLLVTALLAAGHTVHAVNPLAASRYRERHTTSRAKSDRGDARVLADLVRTDRRHHRTVSPDSEPAGAIKVLARAHQNLIWTRGRQANALRSALREYYPGALIAFEDLAHPDATAVLAAAPDPERGRRLSEARIVSLLRKGGRRRNLERRAGEIRTALRAPQLAAPPLVVEAQATNTVPLVAVIDTLNEQVAALEVELTDAFGHHPDAEILRRLPGLGDILGARVLAEFGDAPDRDADARARRVGDLEAVPGWTWEPRDDDWSEALELLGQYVQENGHARVPRPYRVGRSRLGQWVGSRRQEYKKGVLGTDRIASLEALPGWSWDPITDEWQEGFDRLSAYAEKHGHCRVPAKQRIYGFGLGTWVGTCRNRHKHGRLPREQVEALESLPGWSCEPFADQFALGISLLRKFVAREGTTRMPRDYTEQGFNLGSWVSVRRSDYRKGRLSTQRIPALEAIPLWTWDPYEEAWQQGLEHLARYAERTGHTRVPGRHVEGDFRLGGG